MTNKTIIGMYGVLAFSLACYAVVGYGIYRLIKLF